MNMMANKARKVLPLVLLIFFFTFSVSPFSVSAEKYEVEPAYPVNGSFDQLTGKNFLWKAKGNANSVYLLGSLHLASPDLYPLDQEIEDSFNKSDILVVEVDISSVDPFVVQQKFMEKGLYYGSDTFVDHISKDTLELVKKKFEDLGMDMDFMIMYKPWFLAINLVMFELAKLGFDPNYGVDKHFIDKAKGVKEIFELESIDFQINLFDGFDDRQQELFLMSSLLDLELIKEEMDNMILIWKKGDAENMEKILRKGLREHPEILPVYNKIFYERNKKMALKIEGFLDDGAEDYFVIVGSGHLVGKEGIIQLLKEKGYFLEQL